MKVLGRSLRRRLKSRISLIAATSKAIFYRHYYDLVISSTIKVTPGKLSPEKEMGIYLIFPTAGLLSSHIRVLEAMRAARICPIVVSNGDLSEADREKMQPMVHAILERPNIGYDFGGYRDAMMFLRPMLSELQRLWILNDSMWLIDQPESWFNAARKLEVDFVGATYSLTKQLNSIEAASELWPPDFRHPDFHYGSYALCIGQNVLRHGGFLSFWKNLLIANHKDLTVRRGEMGLTRWIIRNGFSHRATCDFGNIEDELQALPSAALDLVARGALVMSDWRFGPLREQVLATDAESQPGRRCRVHYLLYLICTQGPVYALAGYAVQFKGFQFLKKSPARLSRISHAIMLDLAVNLPHSQGQLIEREIWMRSSN
jgi:hypothetical protein